MVGWCQVQLYQVPMMMVSYEVCSCVHASVQDDMMTYMTMGCLPADDIHCFIVAIILQVLWGVSQTSFSVCIRRPASYKSKSAIQFLTVLTSLMRRKYAVSCRLISKPTWPDANGIRSNDVICSLPVKNWKLKKLLFVTFWSLPQWCVLRQMPCFGEMSHLSRFLTSRFVWADISADTTHFPPV